MQAFYPSTTNDCFEPRLAKSSFVLRRFLAVALLLVAFTQALPAYATRQSPELVLALKSIFPECRMRLDGALETKEGDLYLPVMPPQVLKKPQVKLLEVYPLQQSVKVKPQVLFFDNGVTFIRVIVSGKSRTFLPLASLSEKARKTVLAGHLAEDLIVPEGFILPTTFKTVVGQTAVPLGEPAKEIASASGLLVKPRDSQAKSSRQGIFLTSRNSGNITLVDQATWKKISDFPTEGTPAGMAYVSGRLYIADMSKNRILILDTKAKQFVGQIDLLPKSAPKSVVALANGKLLYVSESGTADVAVVEVDTSKVLLRTKVPPGPGRMAMTPNGNTVLVLNTITGQVTFISTLNQRVLGSIVVGANPTAVVVSPDGKTAYVSCRGALNHIAVIDIAKRGILANIKTGNGPTGLAISADGATLYNAIAKDNMIAVFDTASKASVKQIKLPLDIDFPGNIFLLSDGKKLIVSSATTTAFGVLNIESGEFECQPVIGHSSDEIISAPVD
ncbi:MAG: YncE family protein [Cyanobacteriota bacterium erpe_2018_sw_21hr_WHONDRS-SW48-000092_B_bin.40]|nr:YncE family protein [Cyanobacteriota bacterium erpe_2018_sw_21hr_WHONDRS-SW48-000092_B_bin.40]